MLKDFASTEFTIELYIKLRHTFK